MHKYSKFVAVGVVLLAPIAISSATPDHVAYTAPRGRARIVNNSLVADNGQSLRMATSHVLSFAVPFFSDVNWWKSLRDIGHFNGVRMLAFLGTWPNNTETLNVNMLLFRLDSAIKAATEAGMYVIIDNHSECCGNQNIINDTIFWKAVAPRYANDTNVIYELKNEPWVADAVGLESYEYAMYNVIRPLAPNTHIIMWSPGDINHLPTSIPRYFASTNNYANVSIGFHMYGAYGDLTMLKNNVAILKQNCPVIMTEIEETAEGSPDQSILKWLDDMGISWIWLDKTGFINAMTGKHYGGPIGWQTHPLTINWPLDPGTFSQTAPE
jgi:endoglucanase